MPYRITKKKVSEIHAAVLVAPIDSELSTAYRYGLDQRRVNEFRKLYTRLVQGDIVVMSIEAFERREEMFRLKANLEAAERLRLAGHEGVSLDESRARLEKLYG